jgi:hypothetical protein
MLLPGLALLGFLAGGPWGQVVLTAAVLVGFLYPSLTRWMPKEVDHFFVPLGFFWVVAVLATLAVGGVGGSAVRRTMEEAVRFEVQTIRDQSQQIQDQIVKILKDTGAQEDEILKKTEWVFGSPVTRTLEITLLCQSSLFYFLIRWVRRKEGWLHAVLGHLALFRIHVRYSVILIAGMVLLLLDPFVPGGYLVSAAVPLLTVLGTASFIAGVGCAGFYVWALRLQGHLIGSRIALMGLFVVLVTNPYVFTAVGVVDIWLDLRRWAAKLV